MMKSVDPMQNRVIDALITAVIAGLLALPLAGVRTEDGVSGMLIEWRLGSVLIAAGLVFVGRLCWGYARERNKSALIAAAMSAAAFFLPFPNLFLKSAAVAIGVAVTLKLAYELVAQTPFLLKARAWRQSSSRVPSLHAISYLLILFAIVFPFTPFASRYALDVGVMVLTYIMLAWGLNITVGYAGLLDLGYAGFYALGAYSYALIAQHAGIGFWTCLPIAAAVSALTALLLGSPVLRLRGDYFAVVTLGFGEIVRLVLLNWTDFTGGPNGISDIPRPSFFGLEFARQSSEGTSFSDYFHIPFDPMQRVLFLYFVVLVLVLAVGWFATRLRRLPLGRAWESFREDEIACASLGINRTWIKLAAYSLGALVAGLAGAFFAARQGFISPESFTFTESATILAIVILGGVGHPLGIVLAAFFVIGLPELFRGFEQYRMVAFGLGMVLIMVWRPGGMMSKRVPALVTQAK